MAVTPAQRRWISPALSSVSRGKTGDNATKGPFSLLDGHEQVVFGSDEESGLRCIIAIHSTALGPALGGTRFYPYTSEEAALVDVLRLSQGMAYKAACAGLDL